jgi:hypothetical protein
MVRVITLLDCGVWALKTLDRQHWYSGAENEAAFAALSASAEQVEVSAEDTYSLSNNLMRARCEGFKDFLNKHDGEVFVLPGWGITTN